jgi:hypothetical protein
VLSLAARAAWLGEPCYTPCRSSADRLLIFDEGYYVNAARVIAGVRPASNAPYAQTPSGDDGNAEHPQLAKLIVAGMIEAFGDGPFAWRVPSLIVGTLCLLGTYALVRAAGGGPWLAVGAAALMAADNLLLVHGRIFTLDIYVLAGMLWGVVAYLRRRPLLAGVLIGLAAASKMVGPYALGVVALVELFAWLRARDGVIRRLGRGLITTLTTGGVLIGMLAVFDRIAPPFDNSAGKLVRGGPLGHLAHMFAYAANQTSPNGPRGIASYPWQWLWDFKPITYLNIDPSSPSPGLYNVHPPVHFLGVISPPILLAGLLGLIGAAVALLWRRGALTRGGSRGREGAPAFAAVRVAAPVPGDGAGVSVVALAWFLGTYLPFVVLSLAWQRTSYLYYMVIVMPGLYLAAAQGVAWVATRGRWVWLARVWAIGVVVALVLMYPLTPLP